jgi:uncharacterized membrane protein HdeD (DUF308 family)
MLERLSRNWWALALRGLAAIVFGVLAILWPAITLVALVLLFAAYAIVDGVFALASGIRRSGDGRGTDWFMVLAGVAGIAAGVIAVALPGMTALVLVIIIAAWAIVTGIAELAIAYRLRDEIRGEWLLALDGVVSIIFGLVLFFFPGAGAIALVLLIGAFAIVSGAMLLALAFRFRGRTRTTASSPA